MFVRHFSGYKLTTTEPYYNFSLHRFTLKVQFANEPEPMIGRHLSVVTLESVATLHTVSFALYAFGLNSPENISRFISFPFSYFCKALYLWPVLSLISFSSTPALKRLYLLVTRNEWAVLRFNPAFSHISGKIEFRMLMQLAPCQKKILTVWFEIERIYFLCVFAH